MIARSGSACIRIDMRKISNGITAAALFFALLFAACSCSGSGQLMCTLSSGGREYAAYGSIYGITGVKVTENGEPVALLRTGKRTDAEPYSDSDGLNYGMTVADLNLDGYDDVAIQVSRTAGKESYRFFFGDGKKYTGGTLFDTFSGVSFGRGDGLIGRTEETVSWYVRSSTNPDVYEHSVMTEWWTRSPEGEAVPVSGESLTFYSAEDIYCFARYEYDADTKQFEPYSERWLTAEELPGLGLKPFEPISE